MKKLNFKKFQSTRIIEAINYEPGMEDGFVTRWQSKEPNEDGSYSTSGFGKFDEDDVEVTIPYIITESGGRILVGHNYTIIKDGDVITTKPTHIFNKDYQLI